MSTILRSGATVCMISAVERVSEPDCTIVPVNAVNGVENAVDGVENGGGSGVEHCSAEGISEGVMRYLENLLKIHERNLSARFEATEKTLLARIDCLETIIAEKDSVIADLQVTTGSLQTKISHIEDQVAIVRAANNRLLIEHDDLQQYGRRTNIRIEGIEYMENETQSDLKSKIEDALTSVGVDVREDLLERFHRSGAPYIYKEKRIAQTIVRLRFWDQRFQAQKGKTFARENNLPIMIRNDLTRRRHNLLKRATESLARHKEVFAFADVNSNLVLRYANKLHPFNTEEDLDMILKRFRL